MRKNLLEILACPQCYGELHCIERSVAPDGDVIAGDLNCSSCQKTYVIEAGIPRFVERDNYALSFGYQWNRFKSEQIDSINGTGLSEKRFYSETGWTKDWLKGKWILDAGCGAGRFLDVAARGDCQVVGVDLSNATDAAREILSGRPNVHLVQASIYELPFRPGTFDGCYCIGVIQHTPDPLLALKSLPKFIKKNGKLAVTIYERRNWTLLNTKYLIRPLTSRMNKKLLLYAIKGMMPILFAVSELTFRLPVLGRYFMFAVPVANYVNEHRLSLRQRYKWAILDTFDMLAPRYDQPQRIQDVERVLSGEGITDIRRLIPNALNLVGQKSA